MVWHVYHQMDQSRQLLGQILDDFGIGPVETPFRVAFRGPGVTLRSYGDGNSAGPVLLIIPAPIKRSYIWDLIPEVSVVKRCIEEGLRAFLMHWEQPGEHEQHLGLSDYADRLILQCLGIIYKETGAPQVFVAGHSLGGTIAAIFTAIYPDRVKGLILLGAPLHYGAKVDVFSPLVAAVPKASEITELLGNVPGTFLNTVSLVAAPVTFGWSRLMDLMLSVGDPEAIRTHLLVERWTLDELPIPKLLFEEIVDHLYREDRFLRGELYVNNKRAAPEQIDAPILSVIDPHCTVVPPESVLPFHRATQSKDIQTLWYRGDIGVSLQHAGMLVGRSAHQSLWPEIIRWIHSRKEG
ncbi:MAG TPA: alpha/beta fold hydrolase [Thermodesulfobacteriota bacterium]|nr:alpha/beta fold hydrolase [Thermodesulfobacteriota bacterium]